MGIHDGSAAFGSQSRDERERDVMRRRNRKYGLLILAVFAIAFSSFFITANSAGASQDSIAAEPPQFLCAASAERSAWIRDGQLFLTGDPFEGQETLSLKSNLVQVSVSDDHVAVLDSRGRAFAAGNNVCQQCDVRIWKKAVSVTAGMYCTAVVLKNGQIQVFGVMDEEEREGLLSEETAIQAALGSGHAAVLHSDGTVSACGKNEQGQCEVAGWKDIVMIGAGNGYTVGLTGEGKVLLAGKDAEGLGDVKDWTDIQMIAAGSIHILGIRKDGRVVAAGRADQGQCDVESWADMVCVAAGYEHSVGIDHEGNAIASGYNTFRQCDVE